MTGHISSAANLAGDKVCTKCTKSQPATSFRKSTWPGHKDGLKPTCRACEREYDRDRVRARSLPEVPTTAQLRINPEYHPNQMTKEEARKLFHYEPRNGDLFWMGKDSGLKRVIPRLTWLVAELGVHFPSVQIEGRHYRLHVLIWNWHRGKTELAIDWRDGNRLNNKISNLYAVPAIRAYDPPDHRLSRYEPKMDPRGAAFATLEHPIKCPCCFQSVWRPTISVISELAELSPMEERVFGAIWKGGGKPVSAEAIYIAMYEDDPDGGPGDVKMRDALKWSLHYLRKKLENSGMSVETVGYRRGFRIVMGAAQ